MDSNSTNQYLTMILKDGWYNLDSSSDFAK